MHLVVIHRASSHSQRLGRRQPHDTRQPRLQQKCHIRYELTGPFLLCGLFNPSGTQDCDHPLQVPHGRPDTSCSAPRTTDAISLPNDCLFSEWQILVRLQASSSHPRHRPA